MAWYSNISKIFSKEALQSAGSKVFSKEVYRGLGKSALVAGVVVAGTAALGFAARSMGKSRAPNARELEPAPVNPLPQQEVSGPAEGYMPGQWSNYVQAGRGGQQVNTALNPRMNVAEAEDLGSVPTR